MDFIFENAKIDMSAAGDEHKVTFTAATKTDEAEVTTQAGTITVTETGTGTATVIDQSGNVTGLDGDATVTGVPTGKTVTTTGDGKATINGMSFTLSKDGDGVTYTADAKGISAFSGLRQGATLKLEDKLNGDEEVAIKHGGEIFKDIVSVDGIEFTMGKTDINVTLNQSGEQFTDDDGTTYRLDTAGSSIVVGENGITELVNGTKVTVTDAKFFGGTGLVTLEVKDNILIITRADGTTETYKQGDTNDLSDKTRFRNIKTVKGGEGSTILMGGSGKTTLVSGGGDTSLWGGSGNALLVGAKDARDEFFFFGESGRDTIAGFEAGTEDTSDVLNLFGSAITGIKGTSKGVEISTTEKSKVLLQGLKANDKIQWESGDAKGVAKIGVSRQANTFTYDEEVTNYFGGSKKDTLQVSGEDHSVWMENLGSSIEIIDASSSTGNNLLAGGHEAETIIGGRGDNSLWGGAGGNDVLTGGSGYNEFYFGKGEGTDRITKSNDGDKVMLYNVKLEDLNGQATGLKDGNMVIALKDGSTLTLQNYDSHGATTFQLADGTFSYDRNTGSWQEMK